jgi:hypothetical protein
MIEKTFYSTVQYSTVLLYCTTVQQPSQETIIRTWTFQKMFQSFPKQLYSVLYCTVRAGLVCQQIIEISSIYDDENRPRFAPLTSSLTTQPPPPVQHTSHYCTSNNDQDHTHSYKTTVLLHFCTVLNSLECESASSLFTLNQMKSSS